jgi:hypothetical protein
VTQQTGLFGDWVYSSKRIAAKNDCQHPGRLAGIIPPVNWGGLKLGGSVWQPIQSYTVQAT